MPKYAPKKFCITTLGDALVSILEIAVVAADVHRYARGNGRPELFGTQLPLFLGVVFEDPIVDVVGQFTQGFVGCIA